jgi:Tfp pilus assembly protein PilO
MFQRNKIFAALLVFSVLFLAITAIIIGPLVYDIENIGLKINKLNQDISVLDERIAKAKEFRVFRSQNESEFAKLEKTLVNAEMPLDFINFLEDVSRDCQVNSSISTAAISKTEKDSLPSINFQIVLTGTFSSAAKFLKKIESGPYLAEIGSMAIKKEEDAESIGEKEMGQKKVKMDISIKVYAKKQL